MEFQLQIDSTCPFRRLCIEQISGEGMGMILRFRELDFSCGGKVIWETSVPLAVIRDFFPLLKGMLDALIEERRKKDKS